MDIVIFIYTYTGYYFKKHNNITYLLTRGSTYTEVDLYMSMYGDSSKIFKKHNNIKLTHKGIDLN